LLFLDHKSGSPAVNPVAFLVTQAGGVYISLGHGAFIVARIIIRNILLEEYPLVFGALTLDPLERRLIRASHSIMPGGSLSGKVCCSWGLVISFPETLFPCGSGFWKLGWLFDLLAMLAPPAIDRLKVSNALSRMKENSGTDWQDRSMCCWSSGQNSEIAAYQESV
jgi:hypothetical protein